MRIVGGKFRGRIVFSPKGMRTRPTSDKVREALFDILGPAVEGTRFLDAFAGTGAVGIEAASRGAGSVVFIENDREALKVLRRNVEEISPEARVVAAGAERAVPGLCASGGAFDVAFFDPPYENAAEALALAERWAGEGLLADGGIFILEHAWKHPPDTTVRSLVLYDERRYGETVLSFFRKSGPNDGNIL
jgi:16S rRNA (guanine966-N2)-methyltransferase